MHELARRTALRIEKLLRKHGRWLEDEHDVTTDAPGALAEEQTELSACYRAAAQGTELLGQRSGQPTLRLLSTPPERSSQHDKRLLAEVRGVNIHATAAIDGRDRKRLERLCSYVARPPVVTAYTPAPERPSVIGSMRSTAPTRS